MNADAAREMGRGIGIERLRITNEIENQRWSSTTPVGGDIGAGCNWAQTRSVIRHPLTWYTMASSLGRLARFTLFSGPNCSLCDVRCPSFVARD